MKRASSGGFTIVESLIVLGVSGVLFISLAAMVSGQQSRARFKSSMTDISTQIQSQINEVSTGFYPNTGDFRCSRVGNAVRITSGSQALGTNSDCTFMGRAMMYGIPGTDPEQYKIHTLVGLRKTMANRQPLSLIESGVRAVAPGTMYNNTWPNQSTTKTLQFGTEVAWMRRGDNQPISGFAIVAMPNGQLSYGQSGALESGTIVPSIVPIARGATLPGTTERSGVDLIATTLGLSAPLPSAVAAPIKLCFKSGTTNQSGLVTIGANNSTTSVEFEILNNNTCAL